MTDPQNGAATKATARAKERSPNYPQHSLTDCIGQILKVYNAEKKTVVDQVSVARALGYGSLSGASRSVIAALRQFGLLENVGDGLRVSELAMGILHNPPGSIERAAALMKAALSPPLIAELRATHAEASGESLRAYLITKRKFAPEGAGRFVETFGDALKYIEGAPLGDESDGNGERRDDTSSPPNSSRSGKAPPRPAGGKEKPVMQFGGNLSAEAAVSITVTGEFDEDDVETFDTYVKAARKSMIKAAKARATPTPDNFNEPAINGEETDTQISTRAQA